MQCLDSTIIVDPEHVATLFGLFPQSKNFTLVYRCMHVFQVVVMPVMMMMMMMMMMLLMMIMMMTVVRSVSECECK